MSDSAIPERAWGAKAMYGSAFSDLSRCLDIMLGRIPEGEFKSHARLGAAMIKEAFLDAESEVEADPDSMGPEQQALLFPPADQDEIDMVALFCTALDMDTQVLRDHSATVLDLIADRVRAERAAAPSAEVFCIAEARDRREAVREAYASIPVMSRGRLIGHQLAFAV